MRTPDPVASRSRVLAALAIVVLALTVSLATFVGRGGCTPAVAFDRPNEVEPGAGGSGAATDLAALAPKGLSSGLRVRLGRESAAIQLAPVRGIVLDDVTHEPVPFVDIELVQDMRVEIVAVGADARFASRVEFASGEVRATVRDLAVDVGRVQFVHDAAHATSEVRVEIPIGPTIRVAGIDDLPMQPEAWRARIVETALAPEIVAEIDVVEDGLELRTPSPARPDREWSWRTFRAGELPWIRYPRREHAPVVGATPSIELRDDVANRKGKTVLKATIGVVAPVEVKTRPFAKARLRVLRAPEQKDAAMRVVLYDTRDDPLLGLITAPVFDEGVVDEKGEIEFTDLDGGTKHVVGWSREERVDHHFVVEDGPSDFIEVPVKRADRRQSGTTRNTSSALDFVKPRHAIAKPIAAEGRMRGWMTTIDERSRVQNELMHFVLGGVDLQVVMGDFVDADVQQFASQLHLDPFRFDVGDAREAEVVFGPSGLLYPTRSWNTQRALLLPQSLDFTWSAWSAGMQPVFGDRGDFTVGKDDTRTTKLRFEPGWGAQIVLRAGTAADVTSDVAAWNSLDARSRRGFRMDRETRSEEAALLAAPPVPGVTLQIDGYEAGLSDAAGEFHIRQAFAPVRLTLLGHGWRVTTFEKLPGGAPRYVAWLKRSP